MDVTCDHVPNEPPEVTLYISISDKSVPILHTEALGAGDRSDYLKGNVADASSSSKAPTQSFKVNRKFVVPSIVVLRRNESTGDTPRLDIGFSGHKKSSNLSGLYSLIFDTAGSLNMIASAVYGSPNKSSFISMDTKAHFVGRKDFDLSQNSVQETISMMSEPSYTFPSPVALIYPRPGSVIGDGVLAANRKSRLIQSIGSFVMVPPEEDSQERSGFWGYLVFGDVRLSAYCPTPTRTVNEPLIPYSSGEWAVEGSVSVNQYLTHRVTFLIRSTVKDVILPKVIFEGYGRLLSTKGFKTSVHDGRMRIRHCADHMKKMGGSLPYLPSITLNVGSRPKLIVEIESNAFTSQDPFDPCMLGLRSSEALGLGDDKAVLGLPFLRRVAVQFNHKSGHISMCPRN